MLQHFLLTRGRCHAGTQSVGRQRLWSEVAGSLADPLESSAVRHAGLSPRRPCVLLLALLLACTGTGREGGASSAGSHPDPAYIDQTIPPSFEIALDAAPSTSGLEVGPVVAHSGVAPGGSDDAVGRIGDGLFLPGGRVLLVDDALEMLHVYEAGGERGVSIGRPGRGPGEFEQPRAAALMAQGSLVVAEGVRLQLLQPARRGFEYQGALSLDVPAQDFCLLGDTIVTTGSRRSGPVLHLYAIDGGGIGAFGMVYRSPNEMVNEEMSLGQVACDGAHAVIALATRGPLAEVRGYRPDGALLWRTTFSGAKANRIEDTPGGYRVIKSANGVHSLYSLTMIPGRGFLVQWTFRQPEELTARASYGKILSFVLDPLTGHPLGPDADLPPILAASDTTVLAVFEDPAPRFEVRALTRH